MLAAKIGADVVLYDLDNFEVRHAQVLERLELSRPAVLVSLDPPYCAEEVEQFSSARNDSRAKLPARTDRAVLVARHTYYSPEDHIEGIPKYVNVLLIPVSIENVGDLASPADLLHWAVCEVSGGTVASGT